MFHRFGQHVDGSRDEPELGGRTHFTVKLGSVWYFEVDMCLLSTEIIKAVKYWYLVQLM